MVREQILESLAEKYIPEGMHKTLYVNSRENWIEFVLSLLDNDVIKKDKKVIVSLAKNWEAVLYQKFSILN
jgi:hypothetical protein